MHHKPCGHNLYIDVDAKIIAKVSETFDREFVNIIEYEIITRQSERVRLELFCNYCSKKVSFNEVAFKCRGCKKEYLLQDAFIDTDYGVVLCKSCADGRPKEYILKFSFPEYIRM